MTINVSGTRNIIPIASEGYFSQVLQNMVEQNTYIFIASLLLSAFLAKFSNANYKAVLHYIKA